MLIKCLVCVFGSDLTLSQGNEKAQNRKILASLSVTCDERKANAERIQRQQRGEGRLRAKEAWDAMRMEDVTKDYIHVSKPAKGASVKKTISSS